MKSVLPTLLLTATSVAAAAPKRVMVLPIDGAADPAARARFDAIVRELTKASTHAEPTAGQTSFADTAAAVGCDPATPKCADEVIATLAVDELVWGTATPSAYNRTTLVVSRAHPHAPPERETVTVEPDEPIERTRAALAPMFGVPAVEPAPPAPAPPAPQPPIATAPAAAPAADTDDQHLLYLAAAGGGGLLFLIGVVLWATEDGVQADIDKHATSTVADFQDLQRLEDRASHLAIAGDLLVLGGLALGGWAGWELYKHRDRAVTVAPAANPATGTVGLILGGRW